MKKTSMDLLNEAISMGISRKDAMSVIDHNMNSRLRFTKRPDYVHEILNDTIYSEILLLLQNIKHEYKTFMEIA